jgi:competence protein ComGC
MEMKANKDSLMLALLVLSLLVPGVKASTAQIEITEIKNMGVSAQKETHSIIQVSWTAQGAPELKHVSFELSLEVTYADGFVEQSQAKAPGGARTGRFEVPTLHRAGNQPAAEMKSFKASITANYSETTTKQVSP